MTVIFLPKADAQESRCVMIKEMVAIVKVLTDAAMSFNKFKSTTKKNNDNLELLKIYFLLKDVLEDGRKLLDVASPYSVVGSDAIDGVLNMRLKTWDTVLRRQGRRLYEIHGYISERSELSIINPQIQKRLKIIVGSKRDRVLSLFNLGAGLFFRTVFPIEESSEALRGLVVKTLTLHSDDVLDVTKIHLELNELECALEEYRELILRMMSSDEVRLLSEKARKETGIHW